MLRSMARAKKPAKTRTRRTADDARAAILDAAEARLREVGPAGIRLQDVARDVGVSHPTVLHHFGSRESLVQSVIVRRIAALERDLLTEMAVGAAQDDDPVSGMLERVAKTLGPGGHARVMAWLSLAGHVPRLEDGAGFEAIAKATHELRRAKWKAKGRAPDYDDTYFTVLLAGMAVFGDAIAGPLFRGEADPERASATSARFRAWLAELLREHLENG